MRRYVVRYSLIHRGNIIRRASIHIKAADVSSAILKAADHLCRVGHAFDARITSATAG